jgi:hypothetical protein
MLIVRQSSLKSGPAICVKVSRMINPVAVRFFPVVFTAVPPPKLFPLRQESLWWSKCKSSYSSSHDGTYKIGGIYPIIAFILLGRSKSQIANGRFGVRYSKVHGDLSGIWCSTSTHSSAGSMDRLTHTPAIAFWAEGLNLSISHRVCEVKDQQNDVGAGKLHDANFQQRHRRLDFEIPKALKRDIS